MQKYWTKLALVIALLILAYMAATPPAKKLRLGKDLRGGVTLVYSVEIRPGDNASEVLSSVIDVLKNRIDPNNMYEIAMVPQGRDRIEITMPLPGENVKRQKAEYEEALRELEVGQVTQAEVTRALSLEGEERDEALERLAQGDPERLEQLTGLAEVADRAAHLRQNFEEARAQGADDAALAELAMQAAQAEIEYEEARAKVGAETLSADDVAQALRLPDESRRLYDDATGEQAELPSPRSRALTRLAEQFPARAEELAAVVRQFEEYEAVRTTLDDPADLERLLRASGVLSFRISVEPTEAGLDIESLRQEMRENGPRAERSNSVGWFKINKIDNWFENVGQLRQLEADPAGYFSRQGYVVEEYNGEYYMLLWDVRGSRLTPESDRNWRVRSASQGVDELGRPAINFQMDPRGATLLGQLTEAHVGEKMAVLLDDEVYTAPRLNSRISRTGQIMGDFTPAELEYIIRVLNSGSLQNKLSPAPISRNAIGPELGLDYLRQGLGAGIVAVIAISLFMIVYYFRCGVIAVVGLAVNGTLLVGAMAAMSATFTLPGIAGIILTFGMAVDSNVLIFERIREELREGRDTKAAVRLGFSKAMSSIVDGNVTNLIVCIVLANVGTQEIKGFAITLGVGVVTTMFAALVVSRLIFDLLLEFGMMRKLRMLPSVVPALERAFEPSINWLRLRYAFVVISTIYVGLGLVMVFWQRGEMMDTEFRGGTQVTLQFKLDESTPDPDDRITMTRQDVEDKVIAIAEAAPPESSLADLRIADVIPLDPEGDGLTSDRFMIKSIVTDEKAVIEALSTAFREQIDSRPPLSFEGQGLEVAAAPVYPLTNPRGLLGPDIERPRYMNDVSEWTGGVAILLESLQPRPTAWGLEARIRQMREQPDVSDIAGREWEVLVLEGTPESVETAVVLVRDEAIRFLDNQDQWESELAAREWSLVQEALSRTTTLASVQSFSAAMADKFRAKAVVSVALSLLLILIYVWVRFGSVRYSLAAIVCLLHDCLTSIGLIALAEILCEWSVTQPIAAQLGILPFKIDLNMIAALLTIIGYSLNDTIIVMDRVREMRGRLPYASDRIINGAINITISRTVITSGTTLLAVLILYVFGGEGVRGFAYAMLIGVGIGTYSSVAVAAPLVWQRHHMEKAEPEPPAPIA